MSHSPQRKEKDCLNCGVIVQGHYCQNCGQENIEPKETFWHMFTHFFYDITHFDGSFFVTVKDLLFKPGFLTKEYMKGRRKTYLHPVRMYVFTSAVFFLVFFSLFGIKKNKTGSENNPVVMDTFKKAKQEALKNAKTKQDSLDIDRVSDLLRLNEQEMPEAPIAPEVKKNKGGFNFNFSRDVEDYKSVKEYDSIQQTLSPEKRDGWFSKIMTHKTISINLKYHNDQQLIAEKLIEKFLHSIPYLLFVSLPLYALFLKLLYIRRKQFYFADHGVFLIHLYVFTFLLILAYFLLDKINESLHWGVIDVLQALLLLAGVFYTLKAMRNFYLQGWGKTILKFILFNIASLVTLTFLFVLFLFFSFYQV